ncbi:MAG TPA: [FeFe] hydrogenase H-cluster radical SAM maturase HydE [Candidatus Krumholzibacteria bacterium]|nr:[FeFe] hydrogenase H-cluster radical SAM maturase HydE [Candidatus Krumholzibacteria bacterium]HPD73076.1 [FeFe] hydrogenase H-cluster radical SAM maturase HydE [Candidatus Krumholzibacteria bacterium]HRY41876.1 [FeFe] hydrogenase H-cluster radical SAM maturase HydE [Candidatus Krumholzibacteria bacterium]
MPLSLDEIAGRLREIDPARLDRLWREADATRRRHVGDAVHLRGLIEISNHCVRQCAYCGIRAGRAGLLRYRMTAAEILDCARLANALGHGTVVLQAGEDPGLTGPWIADVVRSIKRAYPLAVTLGLGERDDRDLALWREAGADRYLLRFETSNPALFERIHPAWPGHVSDRLAMLRRVRALGYEVGSGAMVGIPGQTWADLAADIALFAELDLDMIGVGPWVPHPATPLGAEPLAGAASPADQAPNDELTTLKAVALARLVCPRANIPSTTALSTIDRERGYELGLERGANVVMPNLTPAAYRVRYEIYPDKAGADEDPAARAVEVRRRVEALGRTIGTGPGHARERGADPAAKER